MAITNSDIPQSGKRRLPYVRVLVRNGRGDDWERFRGFTSTDAEPFQDTSQLVERSLPCLGHLGLQAMLKQEGEDAAESIHFRQGLDDLLHPESHRFTCVTKLKRDLSIDLDKDIKGLPCGPSSE